MPQQDVVDLPEDLCGVCVTGQLGGVRDRPVVWKAEAWACGVAATSDALPFCEL